MHLSESILNMPVLVLYSTSVPVTIKLRHEILKIKRMLESRKIEYEEVDVASEPDRLKEMEADEKGARKLPQLFIDGKVRRVFEITVRCCFHCC